MKNPSLTELLIETAKESERRRILLFAKEAKTLEEVIEYIVQSLVEDEKAV